MFLPITIAGYFALAYSGRHAAPALWLAGASTVFYSFGGWQFVPLLALSILFNHWIGVLLRSLRLPAARATALAFGITGDLLVLGYFKYGNFIAANVGVIVGHRFDLAIVLPIGISFYSFTQIAFLIDAYRGKVAGYALSHYVLFVTYFPHLIAGPILHHKDMIPQFEKPGSARPNLQLIASGLAIFAIGLFKKTCIADTIQPVAALAFGAPAPSFDQAWIGALAYTFQLYFDFSGYSDMAIGLSLMFGIFLPLNFNSPYKAISIVDFWRRWHMTLSQFLRDYLYIPLGGNRRGRVMRYVNLMITMVLGGLWHGAAWTFVIWGALHGLYLCVNHAWRLVAPEGRSASRVGHIFGRPLTFIAVVVAWVFFRADSIHSALNILSSMAVPRTIVFGLKEEWSLLLVAILAGAAWVLPNTQTIMGYDHENRMVGSADPSLSFSAIIGAILAFAVLGIQSHSEFIYFRF